MEGNGKSLERIVSLKALQMGNSFSCQICVIGLLCGVCLTTLFLAALTSFASFQFPPPNSTSYFTSFACECFSFLFVWLLRVRLR
nr:hypothetical protein CTI12_AA026290 [Tanacetum cinerariifolium]